MKLETLEDESLIFYFGLGGTEALDILLDRYRIKSSFLIDSLVEDLPSTGISKEELILVCLESCKQCVDLFEFKREKFSTFWQICAIRKVFDYLKENSYLQKAKCYTGLSIDQNLEEEDDYCLIANVLSAPKDDDQMDLLDKFRNIVMKDKIYLPKQDEKIIAIAYLEQYEVKEIAEKFKLHPSSVYRITKKCETLIRNYYAR
ncbi:MAG: hypothetical protein MJ217_03255 [Bacilli bacterium]|nr:hypothetical protein [Bacilli bacterium]